MREPSEDVLSDDDSLLKSDWLAILHDVLHNLHSSGDRLVHFQNDLPDGFDRCLYQVHVHIIGVVLQLIQNSFRALFIHNFHKDFDLLKF